MLVRFASACAALVLSAALPAAAAAPASDRIDVPPLAGARDLGPVAATLPVHLAFVLPYRNAEALERLVDLQGDPDSPLYGHFLTPSAFNATFAPDASTHARALDILRRSGFAIERTFANRALIDAVAPASLVERFFATQLDRVATAGGDLRYRNVTLARLPRALTGVVDGVVGLDDLDVARPAHEPGSPAAPAPVRPFASPVLYGPAGGFGPTVTSLAYDLPAQHRNAQGQPYDGTGRSTAVTICGNFQESDLATFLAYFGIARTGPATLQVPVDGGGTYVPYDRAGCSVEATLDVQTIVGNAPGTALRMYTIPNLSARHILDAYEQVVSDDAVDAVNSSFGECEINDPAFSRASNRLAAQGEALGVTFVASTGDSGSVAYGCQNNRIQAPASGPHFVGIGGTTLAVDSGGGYTSEAGWSGSGGGLSVLFDQPRYQRGITGTSATGRTLPDVSYAADPNAPAAFFYNGTFWSTIGGTSWSSPLFCAMLTERDQVRGNRSGNVHHLLYRRFRKTGYADFYDVTTGNNGYPAGPGYDFVTGIGSTIGYPFARRP